MTDISPINVPADIRQAESVLLQYRNDICIYTEDKDADKEFYVKVFDRLLSGTNVRVRDIYPLGNKSTVIKKCQEDKSPNPKIYIVDGDIYLQFVDYTPIDNLYRLDAYCIENYVVDKKSVEKLAYDLDGTKPMKTIQNELKYDERTKQIAQPLIDLFFMLSIQAELTEKTEIKNVEQFLDKTSGDLNIVKIQKWITDISNAIQKAGHSQDVITEKLASRHAKFGYSANTLLKIVSGKDWIVPFWRKAIMKVIGSGLEKRKKEFWKFYLVNDCSLNRLDNLKHAIIKAVKS